jgi:hypothetical protein
MSIEDDTYLKYHVSQLRDLDDDVVKLWKKGQDRWCMRIHGMSSEDYYKKLDAKVEASYNFDNDGVGGYGSSGRKPLPKEFHGDGTQAGMVESKEWSLGGTYKVDTNVTPLPNDFEYMENVADCTVDVMDNFLYSLKESYGIRLSDEDENHVYNAMLRVLERRCRSGIYKNQMG